jgi:uncharacterized Zn finger protein
MGDTIKLTIQAIKARATTQSYGRGEAYYRSGAVFNPRREANRIEGQCEGSSGRPYHLSAAFSSTGDILNTTCNCHYDFGGNCKHIVALLLLFHHKPESFEERKPIKDSLTDRSKDELIALIREMLKRSPELEVLLDRPLPGYKPVGKLVDLSSYRRELKQANKSLNRWDYDHDESLGDLIMNLAETSAQFAG